VVVAVINFALLAIKVIGELKRMDEGFTDMDRIELELE
jgi:hypothetical protein